MSSPGLVQPLQPTLVGRSEEVAFCEDVLARSDAPGVVVTGAAGVGKTRLASEVLTAVEAMGHTTLRVTATESGRGIPFGPFAGLLALGADADTASVQVLALARRAIAAQGDGRRVVLLVDDAHLLDAASALLVQQLAAAGEATLIATIRSGEPVPDAVVALWKDHGCEYLELQPLSLEEAGLLAESLLGGEVDGRTKHRLWNASRGLPLVVRELVRDGLERGLLVRRDGLWLWRGPLHAGGRLLELISTRIGRLDDTERSLLELVALGEPLSPTVLDSTEAAVLDDLIRRGLVSAGRDGRRLELRLAHPLFGESVRADIPETRAITVQRRLADGLQATGLNRSSDLVRFAVWRLDSGGTADADLLLRAALLAESSLDSLLAERLANAAFEAGGGLLAERAAARALLGQQRFREAETILLRLEADARSDGERAWVALTRAHNLVIGLGRGDEAELALTSAQQSISERAVWRELELVRSWVLSQTGRPAEAAAAAAALLHEADDFDPNFRLRVAGIAAFALIHTGRSGDALELLDRWQAGAEEYARERPLLPAQYRASRALALLFAGRLREAESVAHDAYTWSIGERAIEGTALMAFGCGFVSLTLGRVRTSCRWFREARELLREVDPVNALGLVHANIAAALGQSGDAVAANEAAAAAEVARHPRAWLFDGHIVLARAWAAAADGLFTEAQRLAREAADLAERQGVLVVAARAAHDLLRLGDPSGAAPRLAALAGRAQGSLVSALAEHAGAVLSGNAARIEAAAARFAEMGALLWAAEAESEAAAAHRKAGREASARAAAARAALMLEHCEGARTPALALAGPVEELTPREREIATLAAAGASNREIAARLVVSVRTVENTLQRAYGKLGVRDRRQLAGVLRRTESQLE